MLVSGVTPPRYQGSSATAESPTGVLTRPHPSFVFIGIQGHQQVSPVFQVSSLSKSGLLSVFVPVSPLVKRPETQQHEGHALNRFPRYLSCSLREDFPTVGFFLLPGTAAGWTNPTLSFRTEKGEAPRTLMFLFLHLCGPTATTTTTGFCLLQTGSQQ